MFEGDMYSFASVCIFKILLGILASAVMVWMNMTIKIITAFKLDRA